MPQGLRAASMEQLTGMNGTLHGRLHLSVCVCVCVCVCVLSGVRYVQLVLLKELKR